MQIYENANANSRKVATATRICILKFTYPNIIYFANATALS